MVLLDDTKVSMLILPLLMDTLYPYSQARDYVCREDKASDLQLTVVPFNYSFTFCGFTVINCNSKILNRKLQKQTIHNF